MSEKSWLVEILVNKKLLLHATRFACRFKFIKLQIALDNIAFL